MKLSVKYIIAEPDEQSSIELKNILDCYEILDFKGSFTSLEATENSISGEPPDIAFIRIGKAELNAFKLSTTIRVLNSLSRVIFISSYDTYAVEAFEYEADGFLLVPFDKEKTEHLLRRCVENMGY